MTVRYLRGVAAIALVSLLQHRLRSFLSIVGIVCGVAAVVAILSIGEGAKREILNSMRSLGLDNIILRRIQAAGAQSLSSQYSSNLLPADARAIERASAAILDVAFLKGVTAKLEGTRQEVSSEIVACSWSYLQVQGVDLLTGRYFQQQDEQQKKAVCILGADLARQLKEQGQIGARLRIDDQVFFVVGVIQALAPAQRKKPGMILARDVNAMLFLPFGSHEYLPRVMGKNRGHGLDEIIVRLQDPESVLSLLPLIRRTIDRRHNDIRNYQVIVPRQLMAQAKKTQRTFNLVLGAIGSISLIVGGIGIMNVLLATVSERTREIGIRRAVGARREDIMAQFLAESIVLTMTGGVLGIVVGCLCAWGVVRFAGWRVVITLLTIVLPMLTSIFVGLCAGLYPAIKAARMDPVSALRYS